MCISRLTTLLILLAGVFLGAHLVAQERIPTLEGIIDFHVHSGPDSRPRSMNDIEAVRLAKEAGLRGVVLKNHFTMTADRAALAMAAVEDIEVFGGVVLNRAVGGLNVEAVRQMVQFEGGRGKVVRLPTFDAEYFVRTQGTSAPFVHVVAAGSPVPSLREIFSVIAEHDLVLATGHSSPDEVLRLIPEARRAGVERILVTHVFGQNPTRDQMRRMADTGAVLELDWYAVCRGALTVRDYAEAIAEIGSRHFLISSDLGQQDSAAHGDGLRMFVGALRRAGITARDIDVMARQNPERLLGLDWARN